jgi:hypothetical protein
MEQKKGPECGSSIPDKAKRCPECGYKPKMEMDKQSLAFVITIGSLLVVVLIAFLIKCFVIDVKDADLNSRITSEQASQTSEDTKIGINSKTISGGESDNVAGTTMSATPTELLLKAASENDAYNDSDIEVHEIITPTLTPTPTPTDAPTPTPTEYIPSEYKSALKKAESYSNLLHMSKEGLYKQLTSEYGENFSAEAANYALENLDVDYNENALKKAESYSDSLHLSKAGIYDQLTSEYGEQFTAEEAQYAVDNLVADYKENALIKAENYSDSLNMSKADIYNQLISEYGEKFTEEEAQYAVDNLR